MDNSSIGTHNVRRPTTNQDLRRGSVYGQRRERGGTVRYTGNRVQQKQQSKSIVLIIVLIALVVGVAVFVGTTVFRNQASSKVALHDDAAVAALADQAEEGAYYALFVADLDSSDGDSNADVILVARLDEENGAISLLSIPAKLQVTLTDSNSHPIADACTLGGDAALINAVANATGLDIAHFMRTDQAGFQKLTDVLGGVDVVLTEALDDPSAGSIYLSPGSYTLSGEQSLTYLRATNFTDGIEACERNQCAFAASMAEKVFALSGHELSRMLDKNGTYIGTDWDYKQLKQLAEAFSDLKADAILCGIVTGYETSRGEDVFVGDSTEFAKVLAAFEAGENPVSSTQGSTESVDPSSFTVLVKNGSGIAGEAAYVQELLEAQGFVVTDIANADVSAYEETLVIYQDESMEAAANAVQAALGFGRVITAGSFYSFDEDILVMYGGDRKLSSESTEDASDATDETTAVDAADATGATGTTGATSATE